MSLRTTAWLAVATAALAAFVWFHELRGEGASSAAGRLLPGLSADAVESVSLEREGAPRLRVARIAGAWRVVEPLSAPADPAVVDGLTRALVELRSVGRIDDPVELAVYGLDPPESRLVVVAAGRQHSLALGRQTPTGENRYASIPGRDGEVELHMVPMATTVALDADLAALRDHRVLAFEPEDVERLRLAARAPDGGFEATLERGPEGWRIVAPAELAADDAAVGRLLSDLSLLRAEDFVDAPTPGELRALEAPAFVAVLEGGAEPLRFELAPTGEDERRLARGREGRVFRVRDALVRHLPTRLFALRAKQVLRFDPAEAERVEVRLASGEPFELPAEQPLVERLSRLDAIDVVAEALGPAEQAALGLEPARARVRVLAADGRTLADLRIGREGPEGGLVARAGELETIVAIDPALTQLLPLDADALRARARDGAPQETAE